jgi:hypothetical protein
MAYQTMGTIATDKQFAFAGQMHREEDERHSPRAAIVAFTLLISLVSLLVWNPSMEPIKNQVAPIISAVATAAE